MSKLTVTVLAISAYLIRFSAGLCNSTDYSAKIRNILSQQDEYTVYEGELRFPQNRSYPQQNPSGIYGTALFFDPSVRDYEALTEWTYFLRPSNALIFNGCTPPQSVYFSIVSYLMMRHKYVGEVHQPIQLFASLGAGINHLLWNTSTNSSFDSLTTFIQTADEITYNYIHNLLTNNNIFNVSNREINLQTLPAQFINFTQYGYDSGNMSRYTNDYDTGTILFRITLPINKTEYKQFITTKQTLFMLEPKNFSNKNTTQPIKPYAPEIRDTYSPLNYNETMSKYNETLEQFKNEFINWMKVNYYKYQNLTNNTNNTLGLVSDDIIGLEFTDCLNELDCYGFRCIETDAWCLGDNRDTWYSSWIPEEISVDEHNYWIILGIMHSNEPFKQTTYTNIAYYDHETDPLDNKNGNPVIDMYEYNGSALIWNKYIKSNISEKYLKNMFVVQLGVKQNCLFVDELKDKLCLNQSDSSDDGNVNERIYLNPITKTRPNLNQIITSILLAFDVNTLYEQE
eukprot:89193_1